MQEQVQNSFVDAGNKQNKKFCNQRMEANNPELLIITLLK